MSLGLSDKPEKWLGKHYDFLFQFLKTVYKPSTTNERFWYLTCPVIMSVGHRQVPVNVVQSRLLIVSMGEGGSRTGDLEGSGACTQWGLVKTHICNPHLRDIVPKVHTERASKARKVGRERTSRHPSASENLGHISFEVGRDDNIEYSKRYDNDPYRETPPFSIQYEKRIL